MCSSALGTEVTQPDQSLRSSVSSVLEKRTEVTEDRSDQGPKWMYPGARLEGTKLEPEGLREEVGFPTADEGFSSIQGILFGFYGI